MLRSLAELALAAHGVRVTERLLLSPPVCSMFVQSGSC